MLRPTTRRSSSRRSSTAPGHGHPGNSEIMVQHFNSLGLPEAEANFDVDLFMQKYFVNADGRPDRTKSPEAVCLAGGLPPQQETKLREAASRVRGLVLREKASGQFRAILLGWSGAAIEARSLLWRDQKRSDLERQAAPKEAGRPHKLGAEEEEEEEEEEAEDSKAVAYLQKLAAEDPPREEFSIVGSYAVRCPSIEEGWDDEDGEEMALDVRKTAREGVYEAGFRFRVLEGVMLLSADRALLVRHRNEVERVRRREGDWDWDYLRDGGDAADRHGSSSGAGGSAKKRRRNNAADAPNPRRFWLMWNGRETGEGHLQADFDMNHTGCIEFTDDRFTAFRGEMNLEFVGGDDLFQGFKVADVPSRKRNTDWKKLHAATYKYMAI